MDDTKPSTVIVFWIVIGTLIALLDKWSDSQWNDRPAVALTRSAYDERGNVRGRAIPVLRRIPCDSAVTMEPGTICIPDDIFQALTAPPEPR